MIRKYIFLALALNIGGSDICLATAAETADLSLDESANRLLLGYKYREETIKTLQKIPTAERALLAEQVLSFEPFLGNIPKMSMHIGWHHEWILKALVKFGSDERCDIISKVQTELQGKLATGLVIGGMIGKISKKSDTKNDDLQTKKTDEASDS